MSQNQNFVHFRQFLPNFNQFQLTKMNRVFEMWFYKLCENKVFLNFCFTRLFFAFEQLIDSNGGNLNLWTLIHFPFVSQTVNTYKSTTKRLWSTVLSVLLLNKRMNKIETSFAKPITAISHPDRASPVSRPVDLHVRSSVAVMIGLPGWP